jgi:hypothetical protein
MRKTVRAFSTTGPEERVGRAIAQLPAAAQLALREVADREDLPLVAGTWQDGHGGCLVANVVRTLGQDADGAAATLDVRVLELLPELSSRDLNRLVVAWDEAAEQEGRTTDAALRRVLRGALARAGVTAPPQTGRRPGRGTSTDPDRPGPTLPTAHARA